MNVWAKDDLRLDDQHVDIMCETIESWRTLKDLRKALGWHRLALRLWLFPSLYYLKSWGLIKIGQDAVTGEFQVRTNYKGVWLLRRRNLI